MNAQPHGLPLQRSRLPPDIQYVLDMATEESELDLGSHTALNLFGDRTIIKSIVDRDDGPGIFYRHGRVGMMTALIAYASELIEKLPHEWQGALLYASMTLLIHNLKGIAEFYATAAITDALEGGCLMPVKRIRRGQTKIGRDPSTGLGPWPLTEKIRRRLYSPHFIRRFTKQQSDTKRLRNVWAGCAKRIRNIPTGMVQDGYELLDKARQDQIELIREYETQAIRSLGGVPFTEFSDALDAATAQSKRIARHLEKKRRATIKRTIRMAETILSADEVRAFAKGEPVTIVGPTVRFVIRNQRDVVWMGHGGLSVDVEDQMRRKLAELCVFIDEVPALEQACLLKLYLGAGEGELDILKAANVSMLTEAGATHPTLIERQRLKGAEAAPGGPMPWDRPPHDWVKDRNRRYFAETREHWLDALETAVYGKRISTPETITGEPVGGAADIIARTENANDEGQLERRAA